jgi:hypothetical protein
MVQSKKERKHHAKCSTVRNVVPKKKVASRKTALLTQLLPKSRKSIIGASIALIVFVALVGAIPFPYAFAKSTTVDFATENQKNASLELGDSKVLQEGRDGSKIVNMESLQSIWGRLFGFEPIQQKTVSEKIVDMPTSKLIANGTKKYQYMMCSDGRYRYFTDEQFKEPNTGFTSKSEDNCKANNQGTKVKLADSPDGTINNQAPPSTISRAPVAPGCKETSVPFGTEYQNASYLPRGTQQIASQGMNGFILRCPGSADIKNSGVNQLVLVGTGKTVAEIQAENDAAEVARQQEQAARDQRYNLALANCIQSLRAQGMPQSSAESNCRSIVRY